MGEAGHYYIGTLEGDDVVGVSGQMPRLEGHPAFWGVYLAVDDVDATTAKVEAAGGKVDAGPFDVGDNGRMSALQDPTGARVNLWQAKKTIGTVRANEAGTPIWNECVTPDVDRAVQVYADVLGIGSETMDMGEQGTYVVLSNTERKQVGGATNPPHEMPPHWNVYFAVDDVDATVERSTSSAARRLRPPSTCQASGGWRCSPTRRAGRSW